MMMMMAQVLIIKIIPNQWMQGKLIKLGGGVRGAVVADNRNERHKEHETETRLFLSKGKSLPLTRKQEKQRKEKEEKEREQRQNEPNPQKKEHPPPASSLSLCPSLRFDSPFSFSPSLCENEVRKEAKRKELGSATVVVVVMVVAAAAAAGGGLSGEIYSSIS